MAIQMGTMSVAALGRSLVVACALITLGCGKGGPVAVPIRGTITYEGQILEQGLVVFYPVGVNLRPVRAVIQPNGTYELSVPLGDYKVTVDSFKQFTPDLPPDDPAYRTPESLVPGKYSSLTHTQLKFTVNNQTSVIDLDLKSS
ncbi:MAG TPA: hypothetical protein VNQ76_18940 [Planctomicrobium sp.]|nr:hypothetical protein [Planctomicrobium sp.]